jgi:hypothetical protein
MTMQRSIAIDRKSCVFRECFRDQVANHISSNAPGQRDESGLGGLSDAVARHGYGQLIAYIKLLEWNDIRFVIVRKVLA